MASKKYILNLIKEIAEQNDLVISKKFNESYLFNFNESDFKIIIGGFYHLKGKVYLTFGTFIKKINEANGFFNEYDGKDVHRLYDSETKEINLLNEDILYFLQIKYGEKDYPNGIYNSFTIEQVEDKPELVKNYLIKEYIEKGLLELEKNYRTIEIADNTINKEILEKGFVEKHNLNWADYDNHCIKSILLAHLNNNPDIEKLVSICNETMIEEKLKKPNNPRIPLYNFILKKLKFDEI